MQLILIRCLVWTIIAISQNASFAAENAYIEVAFFNVGQGNCTIVRAPDKRNVWFFDAGSKKNPINITNEDSFPRDDISTAIVKWLGASNDINFHFVLSHPDEDHYNIIREIRKNLRDKKITFYISDKYPHTDYGTGTFKDVEDQDIIRITYLDEGVPGLRITGPVKKRRQQVLKSHIIEQGTGNEKIKVEFLNAGSVDKIARKQNTNLHSLIVKLSYGPYSVLLTGDATAETYLDIENTPLRNELQNITILQSSHHGAKTEGSNNKHFIEYTNPNFVVFSAPVYSTYDHPNSAIVERYANLFHKKDLTLENYHFFFLNKNITPLEMKNNSFISTNGEFTPILTYRKNTLESEEKDINLYTIAATNYPIFHTGSHGTIIFKWDISGKKLEYQTYDYDTQKIYSDDLSDTPLTPTSKGIFLTKDKIDQNLFNIVKGRKYTSLGIGVYTDPEFLTAIFQDKMFSQLQAIYLDRSSISEIKISHLKEALKNLVHLQSFSLRKDQLPHDYVPDPLARRFLGIE